jgi:hypothetical protein
LKADIGERSVGGYLQIRLERDPESAALIPPAAVGRMLDRDEAAKLIRRIERGIPQRPAAASVRRMVRRKRA